MKNQKVKNTIEDKIADTLFIPLLMRANESDRKNPIIKDPIAKELVNTIDYDFGKYTKAARSSVGCAIRGNYFDKIAKEFIRKNPDGIVVNVGCGLDARYQRLSRDTHINSPFYEMDIPEVMHFRTKLIASSTNDIYISGSILETEWMDTLKEKHPKAKFLFIIEGVLMYFDKAQVREALINISDRFKGSEIACDMLSPWMVKNSHRHDTIKKADANFAMGIENANEFEEWHNNLKLIESKHYSDFKESKRMGLLMHTFMTLVPKFRKAGYLLHYRIDI